VRYDIARVRSYQLTGVACVADNQISTLNELDVDVLTNLRTLELRGNQLRTLATGINIPSLNSLFLVSVTLLAHHTNTQAFIHAS